MEELFHLGVKAVIRDQAGAILLIRENPERYWDLPGGRVDSGESVREALVRELREEIGIQVPPEAISPDLLGATVSPVRIPFGTGSIGLVLFLCAVSATVQPPLSTGTELAWVSTAEAVERLRYKYLPDFLKSALGDAALSSCTAASE